MLPEGAEPGERVLVVRVDQRAVDIQHRRFDGHYWSKQELREAGAIAIFESVDELRKRLDEVGLSRK